MSRSTAFTIVALVGLLLTGCGGTFGQSGVSAPRGGDEAQTVSDAADSLVAHRSSGTEDAKAAISVTDALGSVMRDFGDDERFLSARSTKRGEAVELRDGIARTSSRLAGFGPRGVRSMSQLVMRPSMGNLSAFCQSSAGYSVKGIASLDETFGWQSGTYSGGTRVVANHGLASWSANAAGVAVQAPIGALSIVRTGGESCPMMAPSFSISGATAGNEFSIPLTLIYRHGTLWNLAITNATFSDGESLGVSTTSDRQPSIAGVITKGNVELAALRTDSRGNGTLTITSTGAQYVVADWIVVGT
jgi:hypothetical protein